MIKADALLLYKPHIEQALNQQAARQARAIDTLVSVDKRVSIWEDMMQNWEGLTAMKVQDGVAVIPLRGTVTPDDPFAAYFGETSLKSFTANFEKAMADKQVKGIVLNIYSPGGYVYGVEAAANTIAAARGIKPIIAFTESLAASAAYWLASAADKIVLGAETAQVGSIGVYLVHFDYSDALKQQGVKVTEVKSGEFKGLGSPYHELSDKEEKQLQADVNYVFSRFVGTVANYRNMKEEDVLKVANGLMFYGKDAIQAGLADSINTLQEVIAMAQDNGNSGADKQQQPAAATATALTPEQQAAVAATASAVTALTAQVTALAGLVEGLVKDKQAAAVVGIEQECRSLIKEVFNREATAEEVELYKGMGDTARKTYKAQLEQSVKATTDLVSALGLTNEQALSGRADTHANAEDAPLVKAAKELGLTIVK